MKKHYFTLNEALSSNEPHIGTLEARNQEELQLKLKKALTEHYFHSPYFPESSKIPFVDFDAITHGNSQNFNIELKEDDASNNRFNQQIEIQLSWLY